jgi:hypothetical protein
MEPLFLAVICGCNAGLYHEALNEVYIPRIQRGDAFFAAKVLGEPLKVASRCPGFRALRLLSLEWFRLLCWTPRAVITHDARTAERSADLWLVRVVPPACRS